MNIAELQTKMAEAIAKNDIKAIEEIAGEIVKGKADRRKLEAEALQKEAEAMAGQREALASEIHVLVKGFKLDKRLTGLKSWGFTYKVDKANPAEPDIVYKSVSLITATVKAHKAGGGGATGKSKAEFGLSLQEIYDKFATDEDKADMTAALEKDKTVTNQGYSYAVKKRVQKRAIAKGDLAPVK